MNVVRSEISVGCIREVGVSFIKRVKGIARQHEDDGEGDDTEMWMKKKGQLCNSSPFLLVHIKCLLSEIRLVNLTLVSFSFHKSKHYHPIHDKL